MVYNVMKMRVYVCMHVMYVFVCMYAHVYMYHHENCLGPVKIEGDWVFIAPRVSPWYEPSKPSTIKFCFESSSSDRDTENRKDIHLSLLC